MAAKPRKPGTPGKGTARKRTRPGSPRPAPPRTAHLRKLERSARETREWFQLALDAVDAGTWEWNLDTLANSWSERLWHLYGLEPGSVVPSQDTWLSTVHPDDRPGVLEAMEVAAREGLPLALEWRVNLPGGAVRWLLSRGSPVRDDRGRARRYVGIVVDVSDRKRAEEARLALQGAEAARAGERRFQDLLELSPDAVVVHRGGRIEFVNRAALALLGASEASQIVGRSPLELTHPDVRDQVRARVRDLLEGRPVPTAELRLLRLDGSTFDAEVASGTLQDDRGTAIEVVIRDVTRRKDAERALAVSEARHRAHVESAPVAIFATDAEGRFREANAAGLAMLGTDLAALRGKNLLDFLDARGREVALADLRTLTPGRHRDRDHRVVRADGHALWMHLRSVRLDDGGILAFGEDVTDRRTVEEALRSTLVELQRHVENTPLALVEWDADFRVIRFSARAEEMLGWSAGEILGKRLDEVPWILEEDGPSLRASLREMGSTGRTGRVAPARNRRRDGSIIHCEWYSSALRGPDGRLASIFSLGQDVTAREEARRALALGEERYRTLVDVAPNAIVTIREGRIELANQASADLLGLARPEELVGRSPFDFVHPSSREGAGDRVRRALAGERVGVGDVRILRPDGEVREMESAIASYADAQGPSLQVVLRDVTDERRAQVLLEEERNLLRVTFDTPLVGIAVFTLDGRWLVVNDRICAMVGYPREEFLARHFTDFAHPDDRAVDEELQRRFRAGETDQDTRERRYLRKDGSILWAHVSLHCERTADGQVSRVVAFVEDMGEIRRAQEALRRSESLYRTVAHNFPRGILGLYDRDLRIVLIDGTSPIAGDPALLVGRRIGEFAPAGEQAALETIFREALEGRPAHAEARVQDRVLEVNTFPVRDEHGAVALGLVMTEDVTDRRTMQEQVQVASRLAAMGTLVAGVAHEVNNPLAAIMAGQTLALEDLRGLRERAARPGGVPPGELDRVLDEVEEGLADAHASAQRVAGIVKDLTTFGRPDPRRTRLRVDAVVDDAMRWLQGSVATSARILVEHREAPEVVASAGQLGQVVVNLVTNAARSIPPGRRGVVTVRTGPGGPGQVVLEVQDDGAGMDPEVMRRIFDPFFTTREVGQGMGLGLAVCHAIVSAHGGTISVESRPAEGSTFRVLLPVAAG
jgi:PAS domain S-box-containing protein